MVINKESSEKEKINLFKKGKRFLEIRKIITGGILSLNLFFPGARGSILASEFHRDLSRYFKTQKVVSPASQENLRKEVTNAILVSRSLKKYKEDAKAYYFDSYEITKSFNDLRFIREFLKPDSYFSFDHFWSFTVDVPSRYNFGSLVKAETKLLFQEGIGMKFIPREAIRELVYKRKKELTQKGEGESSRFYELKIFVKVEREFIGSFLLDYIERVLRDRGITYDTLEGKILINSIENIFKRMAIVATVKIEVQDLETGENLTLIGFGVPRRIGVPLEYVAFKEAIENAYLNLLKVMQEALNIDKNSESVFLVIQ